MVVALGILMIDDAVGSSEIPIVYQTAGGAMALGTPFVGIAMRRALLRMARIAPPSGYIRQLSRIFFAIVPSALWPVGLTALGMTIAWFATGDWSTFSMPGEGAGVAVLMGFVFALFFGLSFIILCVFGLIAMLPIAVASTVVFAIVIVERGPGPAHRRDEMLLQPGD